MVSMGVDMVKFNFSSFFSGKRGKCKLDKDLLTLLRVEKLDVDEYTGTSPS